MNPLFAFALVVWFFSLGNAQAADSATYQIKQVQGATTVTVVRNGVKLRLKAGDGVHEGDVVVSEHGSTIELTTDDGSTLVLSGETRLEIAVPHGARYLLNLVQGRLLGYVRKAVNQLPENDRYRMVIMTPTATMGVRGTQFVVECAEQGKGSTFRVLEGVVDVGKSLAAMLTNNFVIAGAGQLVAAAGDGFKFVTSGVGQAVEFVGRGAGTGVGAVADGVGVVADGVGVVVDSAGDAVNETGAEVGKQAENTKKVVVGVTDTIDSGVHAISAAMPFDVLDFVATLNKQLPGAFHLPFLTGEDNVYSPIQSRYRLSSFELFPQGYYVRQDAPPSSPGFGMGVAWTPTWHLKPGALDLRGHVGNSRFFQAGHGFFGDLEFKVSLTAVLRKAMFFEVGPLLRHFYGLGEGYGVAGSAGLWLGDHRILHLIDRVFFGTNYVHAPTKDLWEYRAGVGMTIF